MEKRNIMLIQDAYIEGYEGAFLRETDEDGRGTTNGWWDEWYQASAIDVEGNDYDVYWTIREGYDPETQGEDSACEWDSPVMVTDYMGRNVTNKVIIVDELMTDLDILMLDRCTLDEAKQYLKNKTIVFDGEEFEANSEIYMEQLTTDDNEREAFKEMIDTKEPATDWGIVEHNGKTWYIMYVQ